MGNTAVAFNNVIKFATITAGSAEVNLPIENLQNDLGAASAAWQTMAGVRASAAGAYFTVTPIGPQTWRCFCLCRTNLTAAAVVTVSLYNNPSTLVYTGTASAVVPGYGQAILDAGQDYVADYCVIEIDDPGNPGGFVNVPLAYAGPAWLPRVPMAWASTFGRNRKTDDFRTIGGQRYPTPRWSARSRQVVLDWIEGDEIWAEAGELDRISGLGGNALIIPNVQSATISNEAIFGIIEVVTAISYQAGYADCHRWQFGIEERL